MRRISFRNPTVRYAVAALSGAAMVLAYAPFSLGALAPVAIALLLLLLSYSQTGKQALFTGFWFGLGWFGTGISWVFVSIDRFGGMPFLASLAVMFILVAYLALFPALAAGLWFRLRRFNKRAALLSFPIIWLLCELARGWFLTGFPWLTLGYTQTDTTLGQLAPHVGEVGISVAVLLTAIGFAYTVLSKRLEWLSLPIAVYALAWFSPMLNPMQLTGETVSAALVQGNIKQDLKWDPEQEWPNFIAYQDLSRPHYANHDIVIWPESAITFIEPFAQGPLADLDHRARTHNTTIVSGVIDYQPEARDFYNTIAVFGDTNAPYAWNNNNRYQKHNLLPIGEFVPFEDLLRPLAPLFNLPMSSFSRGNAVQSNLQVNGHQLAANICYEVAYSGYLRTQINPETDLLLTISNDSWFGDSHGPHQHLEIARMRAMEFGRPLLRATNNGITAAVDERGYSLGRIAQFEPGVLSVEVALVAGTTYYTRLGTWPAALFAMLLALFAINPRFVTRKPPQA